MNSTYAPYVILTGTVLAGCVLSKVCQLANRTLPSQHGSATPPLAGRVARDTRNKDLPESAGTAAFPSHMEEEPILPAGGVRKSEGPTASATDEKTQLAKNVQRLLLAAGKSIELIEIPAYRDASFSSEYSLSYLQGFRELRTGYFAEQVEKFGIFKIPRDIMDRIFSSNEQFNKALELLIDFYLGKDEFETALRHGLLALSTHNRSILFKLVNPLIESNSLPNAKETLIKMKDVKEGRGELLTKLGRKYLVQSPSQMENAKELLGMMLSSEAIDLAKSIADKYIEANQLDKALEVVKEFTHISDRNPYFAKITDIYIKANQLDKALEVVKEFTHISDRDPYFAKIADMHIEANQLDQALAVVKKFTHSSDRDPYFAKIADKYIEANQLDKALEVVEKFFHSFGDERDTYLGKIAAKHSSNGEHGKAKDVEKMMGSRFRLKMGLDPFSH